VFDFDGVLVESVDTKTRAFASLYAEHGPEVTERVVAFHLRHGGLSRHEKFRYGHEVVLGRKLTESESERLAARFAELVVDAVIGAPWVAGARAFVESHHQELPLFVVSGTPQDELRAIVERRGMARYFAEVLGSPAKKDELLRGLLARHGLEPGRTLMVGDSITDYDAASAAAMAFLGRVPPGAPSPFPAGTEVAPDLCGLAARLSR
jgi:phosphoglycolate phosphatase-like HAD superfamily hydrolase